MASKETYLRMLPTSIRMPLRKLFNSGATLTNTITGAVTGAVTGNVTGNLTGDVTGDVTGNVTGNLTGNATGAHVGTLTAASGQTTGITLGENMTTGISLNANFTNGIAFAGAYSTHAINFDSVTLSTTLIGAGSYSSPMVSTCTTAFANFASTSATTDAWHLGVGIYMKGTASGVKTFPLCIQAEYNGTAGTDRMEGLQSIALLGGGGEAGRLLTLGGDATAGMYAGWFKVGANTNCVVDSGSRVAPLWIDNQMNCVCNGEEYAAFITCGGSKVDAVFGFETTSSGWTYLFSFDETAYDQDPVSSSAPATQSNNADGSLKMNLNGTVYYIPYFGAGKLA